MSAPNRRIKALLGFMTRDEAQRFQGEFCEKNPGETDADRDLRWQTLSQQVQALPPITDFDIEATPLGADAQRAADAIAADSAFIAAFGVGPHNFQSIRIDRLIARQFYVDLDHLAVLTPPTNGVEADVLEFCMRANPIDPPIRASDGSITFSSPYAGNLVATQTGFETKNANEVMVYAHVRSRPNYVYVSEVNSRYVVQNGYHRAVALLQAGQTRMPCLIKPMTQADVMLLQQPGFFDFPRMMAARPPMASDLVHGIASADLEIRSRTHIMRVGLQSMPFEVPA